MFNLSENEGSEGWLGNEASVASAEGESIVGQTTAQGKKPVVQRWKPAEYLELCSRIKAQIPIPDERPFRKTSLNLDWDKISFGFRTAASCKKSWESLRKKVRTYRLLSEIVADSTAYVQNIRESSTLHPRRPRKLLGAQNGTATPKTAKRVNGYLLFAKVAMQADLIKQFSGKDRLRLLNEQWRNLDSEKKLKFQLQAKKLNEEEAARKREAMKPPEEPPKTSLDLFVQLCLSKGLSLKKAQKYWNKMDTDQQILFRDLLKEMKGKYVLEYESYLQTLDCNQLAEIQRQQQ